MKKKNVVYKMGAGFTLLELMVVIALIAFVGLASIIFMSPAKKNVALRASQREVASTIRLAQSYALQGKMPTGLDSICGWGFRFSDSENYQIFYYTNDCDSPGNSTGTTSFENYPLSRGVAVSGGNNIKIFFRIPHGNAAIINQNDITLSFGSDESKTISISSSGAVTEN